MGTKKIYVNGVLKGTQTNSTTQISPVHQRFYIGGWEGVTTNMRMNGKIDDLRVYNIELTQANVTAIYNSGSGDIGNSLPTRPSWLLPLRTMTESFSGPTNPMRKVMPGLPAYRLPAASLTSRRMPRMACLRSLLQMITWPYPCLTVARTMDWKLIL